MSDIKVLRHRLPDRIIHWAFALLTLVLLFTGFLPVVGVQFEWVTWHWIAGVGVTLITIVHILRHANKADFATMWFGFRDLKLALARIRQPVVTGKYSPAQKMMHWAVAIALITTVITGLIMMVRIDTPFWERNIYLLQDNTWGLIYVAHGLSAMVLLSIAMIHIYFGLRPEKLFYTRSMLKGSLNKAEYDANHDPELWTIEPAAKQD